MQWTVVQRRKPRTLANKAASTCFITFLPTNITKSDLFDIFHQYGYITNIAVPKPPNAQPKFRFAFIRFDSSSSVIKAIRGEDGRRMNYHRIKVQIAKHDSNIHTPSNPPRQPNSNTAKPKITIPNPKPSNHQSNDNRSYKDAFLNKNQAQKAPLPTPPINPTPINTQATPPPISKNQSIPPTEPDPLPDCFKFQPCPVLRMNSRLLGEDIERIRETNSQLVKWTAKNQSL